MQWRVQQEGCVHEVNIDVVRWSDLATPMAAYLEKVALLGQHQLSEAWDTILCDWQQDSTGCLVTHVQLATDDLNNGVGFQVCANINIEADNLNSSDEQTAEQSLWEQLAIASELEPAKAALDQLKAERPFKLIGTYNSANDPRDWIECRL